MPAIRSEPPINLVIFTCALLLSIGSHYGRELLGPVKTQLIERFKTNNAEFALLFAAYTLSNCWTPLLAPWLASRIGLPLTSILATGAILLGQGIVAIASNLRSFHGIFIGMLVFGLGLTPVAICTEVIIIRFFKHRSLGVSLALGLLGGKGASFVSGITVYPLAKVSPHLPFYVSTLVAALSFAANLFYLAYERRITSQAIHTANDAHTLLQNIDKNVDQDQALIDDRQVRLADIQLLGDTFWLYILFCGLTGALINPLHHNMAHILQIKYAWTPKGAAYTSSCMLALPLFIYPLAGLYVDRRGKASRAVTLLVTTSIVTMCGLFWLSLPIGNPFPAIICLGIGASIATLSLVLVVPFLVESLYIPTALGAHKAAESAFSALSQAAIGHTLDSRLKADGDITIVILGLLAVNVLQLLVALGIRWQLLRFSRQPNTASLEEEEAQSEDEERSPLLHKHHTSFAQGRILLVSRGTQVRGRIFVCIFGVVIVGTMALFLWMAVRKK